jgi:hypothetical protein
VKQYQQELNKEINADRQEHGKKPFPKDPPPNQGSKTQSTTDPDSGLFVKRDILAVEPMYEESTASYTKVFE